MRRKAVYYEQKEPWESKVRYREVKKSKVRKRWDRRKDRAGWVGASGFASAEWPGHGVFYTFTWLH